MKFYPFYEELEIESENFNNGNFSLWFNKIIFKVEDNDNYEIIDKNNWSFNILNKYKQISENSDIKDLLEKKCKNQKDIVDFFSKKYTVITFEAKNISPFIIGLGETHPTETGMILDHTIGIPYIPASTIKGAVRYSYTLNYIEQNDISDELLNKGNLIEENTIITKLFGGKNRNEKKNDYEDRVGKIIFFDCYPVKTPKLKLDVMTPHYQEYYQNGETPPRDNQDPNPIKFLTIEKGNKFVLNCLIDNEIIEEKDNIIKAFERSFKEEGIGAKTSIGYGRFNLKQILSEKDKISQKRSNFIGNNLKKGIFNFDIWQNDTDLKNDKKIAEEILKGKLIKFKKNNGEYINGFKKISEILDIDIDKLYEKYNKKPEIITSSKDNTQIGSNPEEKILEKIKKSLEKILNELKKKASKKVKKKMNKEYIKLKNRGDIKIDKEFPDLISEIDKLI